jgi:hypothetical protein
MNTYKLAEQILDILNQDVAEDWEFFHNEIDALLQDNGVFVVELDTEVLNAKRVSLQRVYDWLLELEECLITK